MIPRPGHKPHPAPRQRAWPRITEDDRALDVSDREHFDLPGAGLHLVLSVEHGRQRQRGAGYFWRNAVFARFESAYVFLTESSLSTRVHHALERDAEL